MAEWLNRVDCDTGEYAVNTYQDWVWSINKYPEDNMLDCLTLGLCSEAGEVAGKVKKLYRDYQSEVPKMRDDAIKELGDVLWYVAAISKLLAVPLSDVFIANYKKLTDRDARGVLGGEGDNR